jgi:4-hydroxyisophthalate hydroxylase
VASLETAARRANVPLKVIRDSFSGGREQYASHLVLVRPDQYVAWAADAAQADPTALLARVAGQ